jgi:hypothetical protein
MTASVQVVHEQRAKLPNSFVVVQPGHIRISRKPHNPPEQ